MQLCGRQAVGFPAKVSCTLQVTSLTCLWFPFRCCLQSFEHMPLDHQRLSLYAMGSGMLDMLSEGLDLEGFLATTVDLPGAAAANANGADPAAANAPGSRQSLRWLRTSCQM